MKGRTSLAIAVAALVLEGTAPPCFAQAESSTTQPAAPRPTQQQTVEQLANQAFQLHQQGKYAESIATYLKAYEIGKAADILFNVAIIYDRKLHENELAADYYRRYIRTPEPNPDLVKRATERLTAIKKEEEDAEAKANATPAPAPSSAASAPAPAPAPAAPAASASSAAAPVADEGSSGSGWRTAGIVTGAVGLAGVTASMILGGLAKTANDKANSECNGSVCVSQQGVGDARDAGTFATASTVTFVAGLAVLAAGVTMYIAAPSSSSSSSSSGAASAPRSMASTPSPWALRIEPGLGPSGGGVTVAGSF